jgi:cytochrome P450
MASSAPRGPNPLQATVGFLRDGPLFLQRVAQTHGDVASLRVGPLPMVLVNRPDLVEQVLGADRARYVKAGLARGKAIVGSGLLTSEAAFHDRQRQLAQPAFGEAQLAGYLAGVPGIALDRTAEWTPGAQVDVAPIMLGITARVITRAMFGGGAENGVGAADAAQHSAVPADQRFADEVAGDLTEELAWLNRYPEPLALLDRLPLPARTRMRRAHHRLSAHGRAGIAARRGRAPRDLLGWLLADGTAIDPGMSDAAALDEVNTLLIAAHERTAMALTWTWLLLGQHPAARAWLEAELDGVLGGRLPVPEDLARLPMVDAVVRESLRLYPPVWLFVRQPIADTTLDGRSLRRGTWVLLSPYVMHRDPRYFVDADSFRPERWLTGTAASPPGAYFPFGHGPRTCLGAVLARRECALVIATLAQRWRLDPQSNRAPGGLQPTITLRPKQPILMRLDLRPPGTAP